MLIKDLSINDSRLNTGVIFRCSAQQLIDNLPLITGKIRTIVDLRTQEEREEFDYAADLPTHITYLNIPLEVEKLKLKYAGTPMESVYKSFILDNLSVLCNVVENIIYAPKPVLIHCKHGVDRTGVAFTILLLILGASEKTIFKEYLLTDPNTVDTHLKIFLDMLASKGELQQYFSQNAFDILRQQLINSKNHENNVISKY